MEGTRHSVTGVGGVRIGLLTAGSGPAPLLVHAGMGTINSWQRVWGPLVGHRRVTAMDRRGRGSSGDADAYGLSSEYGDVAAVADGWPANRAAPSMWLAIASAPPACWAQLSAAPRSAASCSTSRPDHKQPRTTGLSESAPCWPTARPAVQPFTFLTEIMGLTRSEVEAPRDTPGGRDVLPTVAATLPREAHALAAADLTGIARRVRQPVLLLLGTASPPWASEITRELATAIPRQPWPNFPAPGTRPSIQRQICSWQRSKVLPFLGNEAPCT